MVKPFVYRVYNKEVLLFLVLLVASRSLFAQATCQSLLSSNTGMLSYRSDGNNFETLRTRFRDKELLEALIKNKKFPMLPFTYKGRSFLRFFSRSNTGRLYNVIIEKGDEGLHGVRDMYAETPHPEVEKFYYRWLAKNMEAAEDFGEVKFPRKGRRSLVIPKNVQIKLELKHDVRVDELAAALRRLPQKVRYHRNTHAQHATSDTFLIFVDIGREKPLEVVVLHEDGAYLVMTAFFPRVYKY